MHGGYQKYPIQDFLYADELLGLSSVIQSTHELPALSAETSPVMILSSSTGEAMCQYRLELHTAFSRDQVFKSARKSALF
jgi:hypothetical protein